MPPGLIAGVEPITIEKVLDQTSNSDSLNYPAGIQSGDLIILLNRAQRGSNNTPAPSDFIAAGFTSINAQAGGGTLTSPGTRLRLLYRLGTGTESGPIGNLIRHDVNYNRLVVFRMSRPISSVSIKNAGGVISDTAPSNQTISFSSPVVPLVAIAAYSSTGAVDPRGFSPSADGEFGSGQAWIQWKFYLPGESPANHTISMADEGATNCLQKCYIELQ